MVNFHIQQAFIICGTFIPGTPEDLWVLESADFEATLQRPKWAKKLLTCFGTNHDVFIAL